MCWLPGKLAEPSLHIAELTARGIVVSLKEGGTEEVEKAAAPVILPTTLLPFPLIIGRLDIAGLLRLAIDHDESHAASLAAG